MHRRARHLLFSAKSADALVAIDSRTITGVAAGGNVASWGNKGTLSATFAGVASRNPNYIENVQGGQPVVRFTGTTPTAMSASYTDTISQYVWICTLIPRSISAFKHLVTTDDGSFNFIKFSVSHNNTNLTGTTVRNPVGDFYPYSTPTALPYVLSIGYNGTTLIAYRTNVTATHSYSGTTNRICLGARLTGSDGATSDLCQFVIFPSSISKSLRRRFETAASAAFKIEDINNVAVS